MKLFPKMLVLNLAPVVAACAIVGVAAELILYRAIQVEVDQRVWNQLEISTQRLAAPLSEAVQSLQAIADIKAIRQGDQQIVLEKLRNLHPPFAGRFGTLCYMPSTNKVYHARGEAFRVQDPSYVEKLAKGSPVMFNPIMGKEARQPIMLALVPIPDGNGHQGAVGATILLRKMLNAVAKSPVDGDGWTVLVDRAGRLYMGDPPPWAGNRYAFFEHVQEDLRTEADGTLLDTIRLAKSTPSAVDLDGEPVVVFAKSIPGADWKVAFVCKRKALYARARRSRDLLLLASCLAVIPALGSAFFGRRLLSRLPLLQDACRNLGCSEASPEVPIESDDEIADIGKALNAAAARVRQRECEWVGEIEELKETCQSLGDTGNRYALAMSYLVQGREGEEPPGLEGEEGQVVRQVMETLKKKRSPRPTPTPEKPVATPSHSLRLKKTSTPETALPALDLAVAAC